MPTKVRKFLIGTRCAPKLTKTGPAQERFSMCYSIFKKSYGHVPGATLGSDVRRIHAFDSWCKIKIKMEVENNKLIEPGYSLYGGIRARSREEATMVQDVIGERLFQAEVHTSLKAFDGNNALNTMTDNHTQCNIFGSCVSYCP